MRLLLVGSTFRIEKIREILTEDAVDVDIGEYLYQMGREQEAVQWIGEQEPFFDAVLFTGIVPYLVCTSRHVPTVPWEYMRRDERQYLQAIIKAMEQGHDVRRCTVDSYTADDLHFFYNNVGIGPRELDLGIWTGDVYRPGYYEQCLDFHKQNMDSGRSGFCITGLWPVCEALEAEGYPAILLEYDRHSALEAVQRLKLRGYESKAARQSQIAAVVSLCSGNAAENTTENEVFLLNAKLSMTSALYQAANGLNAAIYDRDHGSFYLVKALEQGFERSFELTLLDALLQEARQSFLTVQVGVGYGENARMAKARAEMALKHASSHTQSCAFFCDRPGQVTGPIHSVYQVGSGGNGKLDQQRIARMSYASGVSSNTLGELRTLQERQKTDCFTAQDIARHLRVSQRSANRILEKLEQVGAAAVVGHQSPGKRGRPARLVKLML